MERRSSRSESQDDIRGTHQQHGMSVSAGRVPFLPLGSIPRSVALIIVVLFLLCWSDEKPASRGNSLLGTHPGKVTAVAYSPNGRWLASAGYYSPVVIWDMTLRQIDTILEKSPATTLSLAFSPDGANLAAADIDGTVRIWNTGSWSLAKIVQAHSLGVRSLAFSPDGNLLATVGGDQTVRLWQTATWHPRSVLQLHDDTVRYVAFSPDGHKVAVACRGGTVRIWDVEAEGSNFAIEPDLADTGKAGNTTCLAFSPDGRTLVFPRVSEALALWDPATGRRLASLTEPRSLVLSLSFSPDGRTLAAGTVAGVIELWDIAIGQRQPDLRGHSAPVWALAFSPDGQSLVSGGLDGALRLWDMRPKRAVTQERGLRDLRGQGFARSQPVFEGFAGLEPECGA
jgi:WD40 repeat protein